MSDWQVMDLAAVNRAMPTDLATKQAAWILGNPDKANRLTEIIAETVAIFRQAVAANPNCVLEPDTTQIPTAACRYVLNYIVFNLAMEMGAPLVPEVYNLVTRADIWMRMVASGAVNPLSAPAASAGGTPSYANAVVAGCEMRAIMLWIVLVLTASAARAGGWSVTRGLQSGAVVVSNSQANTVWQPVAVAIEYATACSGTVEVRRLSYGTSFLLARTVFSNNASVLWTPRAAYPFGRGEALRIGSSQTNGICQILLRGD